MGTDGRPERGSKLKAINRLQTSEFLDMDGSCDEDPSAKKRQSRRNTRATKICEDFDSESLVESDDEEMQENFTPERARPETRSVCSPTENESAIIRRTTTGVRRVENVLGISDDDFDGETIDVSDRPGTVAKKEPRGVHHSRNRLKKRPPICDEDDGEDDDEDVDADALLDINSPSSAGDPDIRPDDLEPIPENRKIQLRLQISQNSGIVTKSGRISKPPKAESPTMPMRNRHRSSNEETRRLTRGERYKLRENRTGVNYGESEYFQPPISHRAKRRKTESVQYEEELEDEHGLGVSSRDEQNTPSPPSRRHNGTAPRAAKSIDIATPKIPQTRSSLRRQTIDVERSTPYATRHRSTVNGTSKSRRSLRDAHGKESDEEAVKNDSDFQVSTSDESEDAAEDVVEEREGSADGPDTSQVDLDTPSDRKTRNSRKRSPRRIVSRRQSERRRTRGRDKTQNAYADEFRKSFRPRNESIRPSDYYDNAGAGSDLGFSSDDDGLVARRRGSTRRAATRATDSIAADVNKVDLLQNPMALIDDGKSARPKRTDRFSRHRSRLQPTGPDPYVSDDDIPGVGGVSPIEPMQVDVDLSWDDIGGLDHHIRALKEMVFLPLMYPEVFEKFGMEAPKGVLFYGPPGTGKTLCARALAASCGSEVEEVKMSAGGENVTNKSPKLNNHKILRTSESQTDVLVPTDCPVASTNPTDCGTSEKPVRSSDVDWKGNCKVGPSSSFEVVEKPPPSSSDATRILSGANGGTQGERSNDSEVQNEKSVTVKKKPRVAFFMRNGADCLSKWVGEAERQLRLTFEAAKRHQPAIIFFDEIDGLAPVRSSRQDQIHSSIVSTLLGLMDGLDSRGKIVVIGATNRVDAIDPALRRPGRFDRELIFTLPNMIARRKILGIHTSKWSPSPKPDLLDLVAKMTVGYCGADLKALCSESAIRALRRRYPQIYKENDKLLIDIDQVRVSTKDFVSAMSDVIPASHRNARSFAKPLPQRLVPVLGEPLDACINILRKIFTQGLPSDMQKAEKLKHANTGGSNGSDDSGYLSSSDDDYEIDVGKMHDKINNAGHFRRSSLSVVRHHTLRPRLLVCGFQGLGQGQLGPAILHICEGCPVHTIDFPSLHADVGARSPEEALINAFREAARSVPSILYLPHLQLWWNSASSTLRTSLIIALKDLPADLPLLVLATAEEDFAGLPPELTEHFGEMYQLRAPSQQSRHEMFLPILQAAQRRPKVSEATVKTRRRERVLEVLPKAPLPKPKPLSMEEVARKIQTEERYIRMLRMEMRDFVENLLRDRRFKPFWTPVDPSSAPDYYDIIKIPMDIQKIAAKVDNGCYPTVLAMVKDFDIMVKNAIEYNPPNTDIGAAILRRAHGLIDIVHAWVDNLNPSLIESCNKIIMDRVTREKERMHNVFRDESVINKNKSGEGTRVMEVDDISKNGKTKKINGITDEARHNEKRAVDVMDVDVIAPPFEDDVRRKKAMQVAPSGLLECGQVMEVKEEDFTPPTSQQIRELENLWLEVSSGMTVDALEGLLVRCEKVLHEFRFNMDRVAALRELSTTVVLARDDPSLVGKLVA